MQQSIQLFFVLWSLSARRAWIEITAQTARNTSIASLSARRAWIEIAYGALDGASEIVALRKESVDRNSFYANYRHLAKRRSPQGERG